MITITAITYVCIILCRYLIIIVNIIVYGLLLKRSTDKIYRHTDEYDIVWIS
jgi:hypothetical protein